MKNQNFCPYTTPPKEICTHTIMNSMPREGDWICFNCNNLNFAFRKKCNRCKLQTRQQNEQYSECYYYQYSQKFRQFSAQPLAEITTLQANIEYPSIGTPKKKQSSTSDKQNSMNAKLPSVSPLVKKYAQNQRNKSTAGKTGSNFEEKFECSPLCWENQWPQTTLEFVGESKNLQNKFLQDEIADTKLEEIDDQIQEMITRIFI